MTVTKHLKLYGRVQGVFFRESMIRKAQELGITGWVKNCRDGTLEATIQGEEQAVAAMIAWAKVGPGTARVDDIVIREGSGNYASFSRLDTA